MIHHGYIKVACARPIVSLADPIKNADSIINLLKKAKDSKVEVIVFPELSVTGYSCGDLFSNTNLLDLTEKAIEKIKEYSAKLPQMYIIVGSPYRVEEQLINAAIIFHDGEIVGVVPKRYLPNYKEFYEQRWFTSADDLVLNEDSLVIPNLVINTSGARFAVEICEDVWAPSPPSSLMAMGGADLIFNLSANTCGVGKHDYLKGLISQQSARLIAGYVYVSAGYGESTSDVVFNGCGMIYENGRLLSEAERYSMKDSLIVSEIDVEALRNERRGNRTFNYCRAAHSDELKSVVVKNIAMEKNVGSDDDFVLTRKYSATPFVPGDSRVMEKRCREIMSIQAMGLQSRIDHIGIKNVVLGISGGLDSTLALLVCVDAFDNLGLSRKGIIGITMPGFGTSDRTHSNAVELMENLGITIREISIGDAVNQHFKAIGHDSSVHDITYENSQARERTQILMDVANQVGGIVVGTGDMSELALGWATYNGDHMSMYAVNCSVPKTLVKHLVNWYASFRCDDKVRAILADIIDTPISPELLPNESEGEITQKTEESVGPYILHDFFLYHFIRNGFAPEKLFYLAQQTFGHGAMSADSESVNIYSDDVIREHLNTFMRRFFQQQFKRNCVPDGPKVGSISLSPRGDWRMPSDAKFSEDWKVL